MLCVNPGGKEFDFRGWGQFPEEIGVPGTDGDAKITGASQLSFETSYETDLNLAECTFHRAPLAGCPSLPNQGVEIEPTGYHRDGGIKFADLQGEPAQCGMIDNNHVEACRLEETLNDRQQLLVTVLH